MPGGIPSPESGVLIFEAEMKLDRVADIGKTPYGDRQVAVVQDGALSGTKVSGSVMPGALDLELKLSNGTIETEQSIAKSLFFLKFIIRPDRRQPRQKNYGQGGRLSDLLWRNWRRI